MSNSKKKNLTNVNKNVTVEEKAFERYLQNCGNRIRPPEYKETEEGGIIRKNHVKDYLAGLMEATGSSNERLSITLIGQAAQTLGQGTLVNNLNFVSAFMHGLKPQDKLEGILITQMAGNHNLIMEFMRRAMLTEQSIEVINDSTDRAARLMVIFTRQMEALEKYRGKTGNDKVTVEQVNVNQGGQAIVGNVETHSENKKDEKK